MDRQAYRLDTADQAANKDQYGQNQVKRDRQGQQRARRRSVIWELMAAVGGTPTPAFWPASAEAFVKVPSNDPPDDVDGSLTVHERAFVRSLYHQNKLRHPQRSIRKPEWHEMTHKGRRVTVTVFTGWSGVDHVEQHPESSCVECPELRSNGLLSDARE